uniref:Uncharacterized protein n=1 Tax=Cannabis sativa TaxID=3483 RepID=A0A803R824_CANSA
MPLVELRQSTLRQLCTLVPHANPAPTLVVNPDLLVRISCSDRHVECRRKALIVSHVELRYLELVHRILRQLWSEHQVKDSSGYGYGYYKKSD